MILVIVEAAILPMPEVGAIAKIDGLLSSDSGGILHLQCTAGHLCLLYISYTNYSKYSASIFQLGSSY